jgi:hypothetical protein
MTDILQKLTPDQDLQCYFFEPSGGGSAVAALSSTSASGFTVSGSWRQQADWAVIEWNRDNTFEHPAFRNLPDGDLSGLILTYQETRTNCIPMDSTLFATVDWPSLRVWATPTGGSETIYWVPLLPLATPVAGSYQCAYAEFTLSGTTAAGDYVGLAFFQEQYTYQVFGGDTLATIITNLTASINADSAVLQATASGDTITVYYTNGQPIATSTAGANGNIFGMYTFSTGEETWDAPQKTFANGTSPTQWQVTLDFSSLQGTTSSDLSGTMVSIPTHSVRKLRWTYAAALQAGAYERSEFEVVVSDWTVTGSNRDYSVAGPGTLRIEDNALGMVYSPASDWTVQTGNYSGGTIHYASTPGDSVSYSYTAIQTHTLYLGLQYTTNGAEIAITLDGTALPALNLLIPGEQVLFRYPVGQYSAGTHTVTLTHSGPSGADFYFDFIEAAVPTTTLPMFPAQASLTLATDWDTQNSLPLAPERTAWMIDSLGYMGRGNHYCGALWFYELVRDGTVYATATVTFSGTPVFSSTVTVNIVQSGSTLALTKLVHMGMTADMVATAFAIELNRGYTAVWASASGNVLTIQSRAMGSAGNSLEISASTTSSGFTVTASGANFSGGVDGTWYTDLSASPVVNRAARDWHTSFFTALQGYGIQSTASFSMELGNGDPSASAGIAQMGPAGDPILLPTPSLQTNFSPTSLAFWEQAYAVMAGLQASAGQTPFMQFGEVQWWYFPNNGAGTNYSGMPFYDAWTQAQFLAEYGFAMPSITTNTVNPASYPDEVAFLATELGNFTSAIVSFVQATEATCRFEVLYPTDTNQTAFNQAINFPASAWTPSTLAVLKTEDFGFTLERNLDLAETSVDFAATLGFAAAQSSHLVGISDPTTPWLKETQTALGRGFESVVLFALDQYCLIGYATPLPESFRRSVRMGT